MVDRFLEALAALLSRSRLFPDRILHIDLVINAHSGVFRHPAKLKKRLEELLRFPVLPLEGRAPHIAVYRTTHAGHEQEILAHLAQTDPVNVQEHRLVVTAGGDGTSRGALISTLEWKPVQRNNTTFFRLPLGTGNDAADAHNWATALQVLAGIREVERRPLPVIEVHRVGKPLGYAFNIASVGLDAFVVHLTNRFKSKFPGDSYKLMVDVASLFYEWLVKVEPMELQLFRGTQPTGHWNAKILMAPFGATGHRRYGAGIPVLPDDDNLCVAHQQGLLTKLAYRQPFYKGEHRGLAGIEFGSGDRLVTTTPVRVPLVMDGEVDWLEPNQSPMEYRVVDRDLWVLALTEVQP